MQTYKNDMKVKKSVCMHSQSLEQPCKRQADTKLRKSSHIYLKLCHLFLVETMTHLFLKKSLETDKFLVLNLIPLFLKIFKKSLL